MRAQKSPKTRPPVGLKHGHLQLGGNAIRSIVAAALVSILQVSATYCAAEDKVSLEFGGGNPYVISGDTLQVADRIVLLHGIVAPRAEQQEGTGGQTCKRRDGTKWPCGKKAKEFLQQLIGENLVTCKVCQDCSSEYLGDKGIVGWATAICWSDDVHSQNFDNSLNSQMVSHGYAFHSPYSDHYDDIVRAAIQSCKGVYSGWYVLPWIWDTGHRGHIAIRPCLK